MAFLPDRGGSHSAAATEAIAGDGLAMQPRINLGRSTGMSSAEPLAAPMSAGLLRRADSVNSEKPLATSTTNIVIILSIAIPVTVAVAVLVFLHRRNVKRLRMEDAKDPNVGLDFGLDETPAAGAKSTKRRSFIFGGEKNAHRQGQLSMDMNLSSPYLLPPSGTPQSQESLNSLARTIHNSEADPYRPVKEYINSETGSVKSYGGNRRASASTSKSLKTPTMPPRNNPMSRSPSGSEDSKTNPFATPTQPRPAHQPDVNDAARTTQSIVPEIGTVSYYGDNSDSLAGNQGVLPPPAAMSRNAEPGFPGPAAAHSRPDSRRPPGGNMNAAHVGDDGLDSSAPGAGGPGLGLNFGFPQPSAPSPGGAPHALGPSGPGQVGGGAGYPEIKTPPHHDVHEGARGRPMNRQGPPDSAAESRGLGVPRQGSKRLSVGFRPLPPDEVTESEDPEYRANRIRSFYKEYFEESREAPPPLPTKPAGAAGAATVDDDQDDYDPGYLGDAAYYDAETNAFVIPYAQPVTRRAMTPPPANRFRDGPGGPRGRGPRGPHGSLGGMGLPGGPRGRARAGSAIGPRPDSSASARLRGMPKKRLPPPAALNTLPTPSKLKDDSFAILNAIDFAPPDSFREHVAGRSQSPLGERRAYQPKVPVASPLVTSFDELAVLPSPHLLQTSTTFTNLDFAPPKKFTQMEAASDAGSIKSNRSGISAAQLGAIRGGAGRVSRLPGDTVFTQAAMSETLKPQWDMNR